jgi:opacity protein-like surface antigen
MRKILLATAAVAAIAATPAVAKDNSPYVGIEGGVLFPQSQNIRGSVIYTDPTNFPNVATTDVAKIKYKQGYDVDLIGGYDFGMFRLEGELGYKRAKNKSLDIDTTFLTGINTASGNTLTTTSFDLPNHTSVYSAMLNGLADFGGNGGIGGYVGAGAGYASVHQFGESKGKLAWQILAGLYTPISDNLDVGLKYRYFNAGTVHGTEDLAFNAGATTCGAFACTGGTATFTNSGKFHSHSLLLSLVYNFGAAAPAPVPVEAAPPPPPAAAPATQTCPDGSVILATDACPAAPPPPPPAAPPSGERG